MIIEKTTRTRFRSGRVQEEVMRYAAAQSIGLPDDVIEAGDGVKFRVTLGEEKDVFEVWQRVQ